MSIIIGSRKAAGVYTQEADDMEKELFTRQDLAARLSASHDYPLPEMDQQIATLVAIGFIEPIRVMADGTAYFTRDQFHDLATTIPSHKERHRRLARLGMAEPEPEPEPETVPEAESGLESEAEEQQGGPPERDAPELLFVPDLARRYGVSEARFRGLTRRGAFPKAQRVARPRGGYQHAWTSEQVEQIDAILSRDKARKDAHSAKRIEAEAPPGFHTSRMLAERYGCYAHNIGRWARQGKIPAAAAGGKPSRHPLLWRDDQIPALDRAVAALNRRAPLSPPQSPSMEEPVPVPVLVTQIDSTLSRVEAAPSAEPAQTETPPKLHTTTTLAERYDCHSWEIARWAWLGKIPAPVVGGDGSGRPPLWTEDQLPALDQAVAALKRTIPMPSLPSPAVPKPAFTIRLDENQSGLLPDNTAKFPAEPAPETLSTSLLSRLLDEASRVEDAAARLRRAVEDAIAEQQAREGQKAGGLRRLFRGRKETSR